MSSIITADSAVNDRAPDHPAALSVRDLTVTFPSESGLVHAVREVSFDIKPGQTLGIVGESGSGKSVTSTAVMGLLDEAAKVSGSIRLNNRELVGLTDARMSKVRGNEIGMIFQDPLSALTPVFSIGEQLGEALAIHQDLSRAQIRKRSIELLALVGIPNAESRLKSYPHEFSGGMRQRVMIAIAIANDPDVIIADEPTTALDVTIQAQVLDVLKVAQRETGAAVIMITHDLGVVAGMADEVLVMYAGRPVEQGTVDDIFYRPQMPYTMGLLGAVPRPHETDSARLVPVQGNPPSMVDLPPGCPFAPRCPLVEDRCREAEPPLTGTSADDKHLVACVRSEEIVQRELSYKDIYPVPETLPSILADTQRLERDPILEVRNLKRHFPLTSGRFLRRRTGTVRAVDGVTFDIHQGETLALVGESGCGKTTTLHSIMELMPPEAGSIQVMGKDVQELKSRRERLQIRNDLQIVFQDPVASLDPRMTVYEILAEPLATQGRKKEQVSARVDELMELVGLESGHADRFPQHFSGGQRQRIGIARALAVEPKLVVLDEPVSALDVSIQAGIINLLEDLQAGLGVSFLFVAHDLSVVRHLTNRIAVMYLGQVIELGEVEQVFNHPTHPYTHALLSAAPIPDPEVERNRERVMLSGDLPSPSEPNVGCPFTSRCPKYRDVLADEDRKQCDEVEPQLVGTEAEHRQACHYPL
ncbi:ABC transporter ATP-binding protein [Arthrobacter castelli]|uniref:ABC transporter ATP-binding protein n=1 Tax=Arthrobacter castelli TaxID=271431 RepID=UPI0006862097|nr:ABC transporter ATP-binding protein [Arthrobacter castelli]